MKQDEDLYFTARICEGEEEDDWRTTRESSRRTEAPCLFRYGSRSRRSLLRVYVCVSQAMCVHVCTADRTYIYIYIYWHCDWPIREIILGLLRSVSLHSYLEKEGTGGSLLLETGLISAKLKKKERTLQRFVVNRSLRRFETSGWTLTTNLATVITPIKSPIRFD